MESRRNVLWKSGPKELLVYHSKKIACSLIRLSEALALQNIPPTGRVDMDDVAARVGALRDLARAECYDVMVIEGSVK